MQNEEDPAAGGHRDRGRRRFFLCCRAGCGAKLGLPEACWPFISFAPLEEATEERGSRRPQWGRSEFERGCMRRSLWSAATKQNQKNQRICICSFAHTRNASLRWHWKKSLFNMGGHGSTDKGGKRGSDFSPRGP